MKTRLIIQTAAATVLILLAGILTPTAQAAELNASTNAPTPVTPEDTAPASDQPAQAEPWAGPDFSDGFDWIELTSGEWLKGELQTMYDDTLSFDSDKLDLLKLDWDDVRQVRTDNPHTVRTESREQYSGALHIDEDVVRVTDVHGLITTFPRLDLLGLVEGEPKEINYWSFKAGIGITYQTGNTRQTDVNINAKIQRRTAGNRLTLEYLGIQTTLDDVETANNHRASGSFDLYLTRRLFLRPVFGEYYRDSFQNIEHRATVGIGVGYTLIRNSRTDWDVFGGPAFQYTRFVSVEVGENLEESTPTFIAGTSWDTELTNWMDAEASYQLAVLNERSGTYTHHAKAGLSIDLTKILDLDLSIVWDRVETPQERADGTTPEQDDFRILLGVSLDI